MVIAGLLATGLGVVWSGTVGAVDPSQLSWVTSTMLVMMVALGGRSMFLGPVIGAVILEASRIYVQSFSAHSDFVVGALVILCAVLFPEGIGPKVVESFRRFSSGRNEAEVSASRSGDIGQGIGKNGGVTKQS
jgi:branched-chain amino acid transport system permease protein